MKSDEWMSAFCTMMKEIRFGLTRKKETNAIKACTFKQCTIHNHYIESLHFLQK
jgi:hypothetical protein